MRSELKLKTIRSFDNDVKRLKKEALRHEQT